MSLRNRRVERRLWRRIKQEIRKSKRLRKEFKRSKRKRSHPILGLFGLLYFPVILVSLLPQIVLSQETQFLFASAVTLIFALYFAAGLSSRLFSSLDAAILAHYPISDDAFLRWQAGRTIGRASVIFFLSAALYAFYAVGENFEASQWAGALFLCFMNWVLVTCAAIILVRIRPFAPWARIATIIAVALVISCFVARKYEAETASLWAVIWIWPGTWINNAFHTAIMGEERAMLFAAVLPLLLVPVALWCVNVMSRYFEAGMFMLDNVFTAEQYQDLVGTEQDDESGGTTVGPLSTVSHQSQDVSAGGWIEAWIDRIMNGRDKTVLEFLTAGARSWGRHWKLSMIFIAGGLLAPLLGTHMPYAWLLLLLPVIGFARGLPIAGGEWHGVGPVNLGTFNQAPFAQYPLGYWEMTRVMLKVNLVRILACAPAAVLFALAICWSLHLPVLVGLRAALASLYIIAGFQVFVVGFKIFDKTSARNMNPFISILGIPMMIFGLLNGLGCIGAMFVAPWWGALLAAVGYIIPGAILWLWFGFLFNHRKTDLFFVLQPNR